MNRLRRNLWLAQGIRALYYANPYGFFLVPFLLAKGLTPAQAVLIPAVQTLVTVFIQAPTGYIADRYGHKRSLYIGIATGIMACAAYTLLRGFWLMCMASVVLAVAKSFLLGPETAVAYESADRLEPSAKGQSELYRKFERRGSGYIGITLAVANWTADAVVRFSGLIYLMWLQALVFILKLPLVMGIHEARTQSHGSATVKRRLIPAMKHIVRGRKKLLWTLLFWMSANNLTLIPFALAPLYYIQVCTTDHPEQHAQCEQGAGSATWWIAFSLTAPIFALFAKRFHQRLGRFRALGVLVAVAAGYYSALSWVTTTWGMLAVLGTYFVAGMQTAVMQPYVNELATSEERATVLSLGQAATCAMYALVTFTLSRVLEFTGSLAVAFSIAGAATLIPAVITLYKMRRYYAGVVQ